MIVISPASAAWTRVGVGVTLPCSTTGMLVGETFPVAGVLAVVASIGKHTLGSIKAENSACVSKPSNIATYI